jgi:deoxyadenosine/deoxycytidine kinase
MHIELIGSTSAGKTTLAKKMVEAGKKSGVHISLSDDFMLEQLKLGWVRNEFVRRRLVEAAAFAICLTCLAKYKEFFAFVIREGRSYSGSWFYKINRIRNVFRKIGIFEFISRRSASQQVILADNEGILQGVHNLFVHQNSQADLEKIARYAELVPLPDVVLYLQQEEDVLISRTLGRGHARVAGSSPDHVVHFIRQAVAVFDELISSPKIQERLLIVDGGWNISHKVDHSPTNFHRVTELVRIGH